LFDFWALNLDKSVLSLESRLYPSLKPFERGEDVLRELSSSVYVAYKTSDALELRQLFEKNSSLEIPEAWLVQYAISFNPCIPPDLALRIAVNNQPELFDYEIKKGLLQNRAINYQSNPELIDLLVGNQNRTVTLYARIKRDKTYLETLPQLEQDFLINNINHIL